PHLHSFPTRRSSDLGRWGTIPLQPLMHRSPVLVLVAVVLLSACSGSSSVAARPTPSQSGTQVLNGSIGAAAYVIDLPVDWNGTLFLYSHGSVAPGAATPASAAPDRAVAQGPLDRGSALAAPAHSSTGWATGAA